MSWNHTPPSVSPRKSKIQQQSWDGTPTIKLYDPNREFYESSPNMPIASVSNQPIKKSPVNQPRKINYSKYQANATHQMSDPGNYYSMASSALKSPKSPKTPTFDFELSAAPQKHNSPIKCVTSNRRYYEDSSSESAPATLTSSLSSTARKYEFGPVSPKFDNTGKS
jgi:hypothetical protein